MSDANYGEEIVFTCRIAFPQIGFTSDQIANKVGAMSKAQAKFAQNDKKTHLTALIAKSDKASLKAIKDACCEVAEAEDVTELEKWPLVDKKGDLRDGDDERHEETDGYAGSVYFVVGSNNLVTKYMIDEDGEMVEVSEEDAREIFYPGANCRLVVQPSEYDEGCVTFYLKGIMRIDDEGKRLGGSGSSAAVRSLFQSSIGGSKKKATPTTAKKKKAAKKEVEIIDEETEDGVDEEEVEAPKKEVKKKKKARKSKSDISSILDD